MSYKRGIEDAAKAVVEHAESLEQHADDLLDLTNGRMSIPAPNKIRAKRLKDHAQAIRAVVPSIHRLVHINPDPCGDCSKCEDADDGSEQAP